ncbi:hypothetical protein RRG08_004284 [Elysia crispata]|uniref:Uncharacterized protein n=1 Tax=Elysia crispata TaxID=231223 RepID=A0AAE0YCF5_9GAST|nr:hypothetical protein RRG08_004284 [Elysia crispata]
MERRHVLTEDDFEGWKDFEQDDVVIKITGEKPTGTRAVEIQTILTAELGPGKHLSAARTDKMIFRSN